MMVKNLAVWGMLLLPSFASGALHPDKFYNSENRKSGFYIRDGVFVGGDKSVERVVIKDIRRASNEGFERIVIDVQEQAPEQGAKAKRTAYYHVAVSPEERRLVFTIWGNPMLGFDAKKVTAAFKKSKAATGIELYPLVEESSWTFAMGLNGVWEVEVFELANPSRIIMDVRQSKASKAKAK